MNLTEEIIKTLDQINSRIKTDDETVNRTEQATLLLAKANILLALSNQEANP